MRVVAVPKENAQGLIQILQANRLIDRRARTAKRDTSVLIPVVSDPPFDLEPFRARIEDHPGLPPRPSTRDPAEEVRQRLAAAGIRPEHAPRRWERIGDVLVIRIPLKGQPDAKAIAETFARVLAVRTVVEDRSGIHGRFRIPDVRVLWGDETETVHVEGGLRYSIDVARLMFSSGNLAERLGIADRIRPGSVVVDLFAGIGYFALPIAVRGRAETVYACELNPVGFEYLLRNIRLNRAANVVALFGDCRDVAPHGVADWVIMGHFDARGYLDVAFRALRGRGTIVYHELCPKEQYPDAMSRRLAAAARAHWMDVVGIRARIVKSYAPGIVHSAAEVEVAPQTRASKTEMQK